MKRSCICGETDLFTTKGRERSSRYITGGICRSCLQKLTSRPGEYGTTFLSHFDSPILLMQPDPRKVCNANRSACDLFGKDLFRIQEHRGGEVFDCVHSFTEEGCGKDMHCEDCRIRNTIVETFTTGKAFNRVAATLEIRKGGEISAYRMVISTEKVGSLALLRIDCFEPVT